MIDFVHSVIVYVADVDAAIDFYTNTLDMELTADMPMGPENRWVTVRPTGSQTALSLSLATEPRPEKHETGITLIAREIDAFYADLTARGVRFGFPVQEMPWGAKGTEVLDPDGNAFFVTDTP